MLLKTHFARTILAVIAVSILASAQVTAAERPNVVVIVADDLGWADVGYHGGNIDTPSLDRLAEQGVQLNRFYTTPICSPTRAALMTGRDPMRLGVAYGVIMPWDNIGVNPAEHFMPESFGAAGYQTAMVGKWHLGHAQMTYHPNERGFEHFYGHLHTEVGFYPPFANVGGKDFQVNGVTADDEGYETYLLADEVSRYIRERDTQKPFFIYMPFIAPHTPLDAPAELQEKYKDIDTDLPPARSNQTDSTRRISKMLMRESARPMYAAVVDGMDQAIGQVLNTLDEEGLSDNTIVLFFSDNGGAAYSYGGADNAPLRGGKGETFEGGIRVVSLMRWPEKLQGGQIFDQVMTVMDVFPTLADAAGVDPLNTFEFDGSSLWPSISEGTTHTREDMIMFASEIPIYGSFKLTAFDNTWKLVQEMEQDQLSTTVTNYLFKIADDPNEYNNLAAEYPDIVVSMSKAISEWRALHPVSGTRSVLIPPPGWRAPKDWASYPRPLEDLQSDTTLGLVPSELYLRILDMQHGQRGRLMYGCSERWWSLGFCLESN
ncbi:arylsulfatase [Luminiphilus sp.]|nr:arylsulfatase [Luminiphilus sp.]MDB2380490.1 arylsulfatase [Luminiphilus sp.]MDB2557964.1 arylsulfatase [Luminiphilus sp.]